MEKPLAAARQAGVNDHFHVADGHGTLSNVGAQDHLAPWWHHGGTMVGRDFWNFHLENRTIHQPLGFFMRDQPSNATK